MAKIKILFLGDAKAHSNAHHRCQALRRIGCEVVQIDPEASLGLGRLTRALNYRTGYFFAAMRVRAHVLKLVSGQKYDLAWVDCGQSISGRLIEDLRRNCRYIINYNTDDPTGTRDGLRWGSFRRAIPHYDLLAVVRDKNIAEFRRRGARKVIRVYMSYDPVAHAPLTMFPAELAKWSTDVAFIGTWMPERGPFLKEVLDRGIPLTIFGDGWHKSKKWGRTKPNFRPPPYGRDYVAAVQSAKICLGLVSKGNRDLHTTRSLEIPFIGTLLCAERTSEHLGLYAEDTEAVFWSGAEECALKCADLLQHPAKRVKIAAAGRAKVQQLRLSNDAVLEAILAIVFPALPNR